MAIVISGINNNDKITASDGTIDLLSGVNYVGVITAPAITSSGNITASGNLTAGHLNIGSGIQLGNAGIITATTLVGNVTGNVNHTSNLLLQISGSEKLRIANSGAFGLNGTNYGSSGQVLTSQGSGSSPIWSTITGTTINTNDDNRIITGSGTANTLNGESNLTFDGTNLLLGTTDGKIQLKDGNNYIQFVNADKDFKFMNAWGAGEFTFHVNGGERLRITSDGKIGINETSPDGMLHLKGGVPAIFLEDTDGTHGQAIIEQNGDILKIRQDAGNASSGTGSVIQFEVDGSAWGKVDTAFGLKADNTCKAWLCYRSEAGLEQIVDDFNVATVNDEGTGSFGVNLEVNVHRHGNGWSQSIVFGCYNDGSRPLIAGVGYAPSHGSNNPWWDVEDNFVRVNTQRSTDGVKVDAKVFNLAMFGDTGDLNPA